jgi:hypothetical protein
MPSPPGSDNERILRDAEAKAEHAEGQIRSLVWTEEGLVIAIVSDLPDAEAERFAAALGRSVRQPLPPPTSRSEGARSCRTETLSARLPGVVFNGAAPAPARRETLHRRDRIN